MLSRIFQALGVVVACILLVSSCATSVASSYSAASSKITGLCLLVVIVWLFINWIDSEN